VNTVAWLLESDPAISWQAMRDLAAASSAEIAEKRARLSREGICASVLTGQEADGSWRLGDKPIWLSTLFTLLFLRAAGVERTEPAVKTAVARLESQLQWDDEDGFWELRLVKPGGRSFFEGEVEPCINGGTLALGGYFGRPNENLMRRLLAEQLADGGWNCEAPKSSRSSFHTTICVLEGLLEYERAVGFPPEVTAARKRGEEYLLERGLFRRRSTGEVANPEFLELAFPPRYHYDVLRALDYFREAERRPDPRMGDAVSLIKNRRQTDGRWLLERAYDEPLPFSLGESVGEPSRWNTLRALRVLRWYEER
jgi:hypothetical protein